MPLLFSLLTLVFPPPDFDLLRLFPRTESPPGIVIPAAFGGVFYGVCGPRDPYGCQGFFTPTPEEIADLETQLPPFLRRNYKGSILDPDVAWDHMRGYRQYLGVVIHGRRQIWGYVVINDNVPPDGLLWRGNDDSHRFIFETDRHQFYLRPPSNVRFD